MRADSACGAIDAEGKLRIPVRELFVYRELIKFLGNGDAPKSPRAHREFARWRFRLTDATIIGE